jgi:hypothetical protein
MRIASAILSVCVLVLLSGCCSFDYDTPSRGATASIRESAPAPKRASMPEPAASEAEKAQKSIAEQCTKRHVDLQNGVLKETEEDKRMRNAICGPFYRGGG